MMKIEEILHILTNEETASDGELVRGELKEIEFKEMLPKDSAKYIKTIVAYANAQGGNLIVGVADGTLEVVGVPRDELFQAMD